MNGGVSLSNIFRKMCECIYILYIYINCIWAERRVTYTFRIPRGMVYKRLYTTTTHIRSAYVTWYPPDEKGEKNKEAFLLGKAVNVFRPP